MIIPHPPQNLAVADIAPPQSSQNRVLPGDRAPDADPLLSVGDDATVGDDTELEAGRAGDDGTGTGDDLGCVVEDATEGEDGGADEEDDGTETDT